MFLQLNLYTTVWIGTTTAEKTQTMVSGEKKEI